MATHKAGRALMIRAVIALVAGLAVTFSADHSPLFGFIVCGIFATLGGIATVVVAGDTPADRALEIGRGVVSCAAGVCALSLCFSTVGLFIFLVSAWAAITGFLEIYVGIRANPRWVASREARVVGGLTAILALVELLIPADSVLAIGLFGAYAMLVGTYSMIAGLSLRWNTGTNGESEPPFPSCPLAQPRRTCDGPS